MSRKILFLFTILFIISAIAAPVYANQTVFGPKDLTIGRWHVHLSSHRFSVDDPSDGILTILKNTPDKKIRGGFCFLNGKFISLRSFLKGTGTLFEKDVNLRSNNRITVFLRGTPDAIIKIEIKKKSATPPPEITFTAAPQTITLGESSTLTWTTTNAESVSINHGIGNVSENGSNVVTPQETTTYSITATGPGGTTTASITVTVNIPAPTVSISADPATIYIGQSSTLSWTSTHADTCVIEPGIGSVALNESTTVSPTETTTYTITATGSGGTATDSVTITANPQIALTITSPLNNENITRPCVMVQGTITNDSGFETGVTVNGIVAIVNEDQFVANHVPLQEGENTIIATANDIQGYTINDSVIVNAEASGDYIKITAMPETGVSPLETRLSIDGSLSFTESSLSIIGPGTINFLESGPDEYLASITGEGIYYFSVEVTDTENNVHTDTVAIEVIDEAQLDVLLKTKWNGMKAALANQDIENALNYFTENTKNLYNEIYTAIYDNLPQIGQDMQDIELIYAEDNLAKYRIKKNELYDGEMLTITYYIYFEKDEKGLWKICRY